MENDEILQKSPDSISVSTVIQKPKDYLYVPRVIFCILGMVLGLCLVITVVFNTPVLFRDMLLDYGGYVKKAEFGADFYTYIYDAVRYASENTYGIAFLLADFTSNFCILFGSGFFLGFGIKLFEVIAQHKRMKD